MKDLTEQQLSFIRKREQMVRLWPAMGTILFAIEAGLVGWLFWKHPLLVNPGAVRAGIESGAISNPTLSLLAAMLPFMLIMCLTLVAVVLAYAFVALANEKKLLVIIRTLMNIRQRKGGDDRE